MGKMKKVFGNRPASLTLVILAVVFYAIAAFTATTAMNSLAGTCIAAALVFAVFFDL